MTPKKQGESPTAYASMLKKEMGEIRWEESGHLYRAADPGVKSLAQRLYRLAGQDHEDLGG